MNTKPFWQSKTVILNAVTLAVAIAQLVATQPWLSPEVATAIGSVVAIINIYLRATTDTTITLK